MSTDLTKYILDLVGRLQANELSEFARQNLTRGEFTAYLGKGDGTSTIVNSLNTMAREVFAYEKRGSTAQPYFVAVLAETANIPYMNSATWVNTPVRVGKRPGSDRLYILGTSQDVQAYTASSGQTPLEQWISAGGGTGGTVTSITAGTGLTGGTITTSGTVALSTPVAIANGGTGAATANANVVFAGPTSGGAAAPAFRALVASDIPLVSGTVDLTGTAGETLAARDAVYLRVSDGKWYKIDIDATSPVLCGVQRGFATAAITANNSGTIRVFGSLAGFSSLTVGDDIWAHTTAGAVTQAKPTIAAGAAQRAVVRLGYAAAADTVFIAPSPVRFVKRDSLANNGTLTIEHYTDELARSRKALAYLSNDGYGSNLATNSANVSVSGYQALYPASQAVDGSLTTVWWDNTHTSSGTAWIAYDFGSGNDKDIRQAQYVNGPASAGWTTAYHPTSVKVQYSDNGSSWSDAATASVSDASDAVNTVDFSSVSAHRYWRLLDNSGTTSGWGMAEFRLMELSTTYEEPCVVGRDSAGTRDVGVRFDDGSANPDTFTRFKNVIGSTADLTMVVELP